MTSAAATYTGSIYVRGVTGSGTIYLSGLGAGGTVACAYTSAAWTRCSNTTTTPLTTNYFMVGCEQNLYGMPATCPAWDVLLWGAQVQVGAEYASSYIPTQGAAASVAAESASFLVPLSTGADFSIAETVSAQGIELSRCAGNFIFGSTPGPQLFDCFITGVLGQVMTPGGYSMGTLPNSLPATPFSGARLWLSWSRQLNRGAFGTPTDALQLAEAPGVSSVNWGPLTLGPEKLHKSVCVATNSESCR